MGSEVGIPFGNYTLLKRIAQGGMAEVFVARQKGMEGFDRLVAIKRILPHLLDDQSFVRMFQDEAKLAACLTHPGIVHIYDFGKVEEHFFIGMEFIHGVHTGDLIKLAATHPIPAALVARIGADACAGLHYAHNRCDKKGEPLRVVHRDVSPPNLLVSFDGNIKLVDFGIAKAVNTIEKTRSGIVKGKFAYMSPEQTMGKPLDGRSDVFSLAIVLWELLTGQGAVTRNDQILAMQTIRDGKVLPVESIRKDIPLALAKILKKALHKNPAKRSNARTFGADLEQFLKTCNELATHVELGSWLREHIPPTPVFEDEDPVAIGEGLDPSETLVTGINSDLNHRIIFATPGESEEHTRISQDETTDNTKPLPEAPSKPFNPNDSMEEQATIALNRSHVLAQDPTTGRLFGNAAVGSPPSSRNEPSVEISLTAKAMHTDTSVTTVRPHPFSELNLDATLQGTGPVHSDNLDTMVVVEPLTKLTKSPVSAKKSPVAAPRKKKPHSAVHSLFSDETLATEEKPQTSSNKALLYLVSAVTIVLISALVFVVLSRVVSKSAETTMDAAVFPEASTPIVIPLPPTIDSGVFDAAIPPIAAATTDAAVTTPVVRKPIVKREKPGQVTIRTSPYSNVFHRGKRLGTTPIANLPLKPGTYKLVFKNPDHPDTIRTVVIKSNRTTKVDIELRP